MNYSGSLNIANSAASRSELLDYHEEVIQDYEQRQEILEKENRQISQNYSKLHTENQQLLSYLNGLEVEVSNLNEKLKRLRQAKHNIKRELVGTIKQNSQLKQEFNQQRVQTKHYKAVQSRNIASIQQYKEKIHSLNQYIEQLEDKVTDLSIQHKKETCNLRAKINNLEDLISLQSNSEHVTPNKQTFDYTDAASEISVDISCYNEVIKPFSYNSDLSTSKPISETDYLETLSDLENDCIRMLVDSHTQTDLPLQLSIHYQDAIGENINIKHQCKKDNRMGSRTCKGLRCVIV